MNFNNRIYGPELAAKIFGYKKVHTNKGIVSLNTVAENWTSKPDEFTATPLMAVRLAKPDPFDDVFIPIDRVSMWVRNPSFPLKYIQYSKQEDMYEIVHRYGNPEATCVLRFKEIDNTFEDRYIRLTN